MASFNRPAKSSNCWGKIENRHFGRIALVLLIEKLNKIVFELLSLNFHNFIKLLEVDCAQSIDVICHFPDKFLTENAGSGLIDNKDVHALVVRSDRQASVLDGHFFEVFLFLFNLELFLRNSLLIRLLIHRLIFIGLRLLLGNADTHNCNNLVVGLLSFSVAIILIIHGLVVCLGHFRFNERRHTCRLIWLQFQLGDKETLQFFG